MAARTQTAIAAHRPVAALDESAAGEAVFDPETFDPTTLHYTQFPQHYFPLIHASTPVFYSPLFKAWMVYDHALGQIALADPRFSRNRKDWEMPRSEEAERRWPLVESLRRDNPFVNSATQRTTRTLYSGALRPRAIKRMEAIIAEVIAAECASLVEGGEVDIVKMVSKIPNKVISRVVGVPSETQQESRFMQAASDYLLSTNPMAPPENRDIAESATRYLFETLSRMIEERSAAPGDDLVSGLLESAGEADLETLKRTILISITSLLSAGTDTTRHSVSLALKTLMTRPPVYAHLRDHRDLLDQAVFELLRFDFPAKYLVRFATEDIDLGGQRLRKGNMVLVTIHGCGWDPRIFPQPDRLLFDRDSRSYLTFGYGPYYCIGAHLARYQIKTILNFFFDHCPGGGEVQRDAISWEQPDLILRGMASMPVVLR